MQMTLKIIEKQKYSRLRDRERKNGGRISCGFLRREILDFPLRSLLRPKYLSSSTSILEKYLVSRRANSQSARVFISASYISGDGAVHADNSRRGEETRGESSSSLSAIIYKNPNDPLVISTGNGQRGGLQTLSRSRYLSAIRNLSLNINAVTTRGAGSFYNHVQGSRDLRNRSTA